MSSIAHPLVFIRHGETQWNSLGRYQGTTDIVLSNDGVNQAHINAAKINDLGSAEFHIVTSPLLRAAATADIISQSLPERPSINIQPAFRELSLGRWEGLNSQQVKDKYYKERQGRKLDRWNFKPVGGESMAERAGIIEDALGELKPHTIVVTHCVVLRIILHLLGGVPKEEAAQAVIPHIGLLRWDGALLHRQKKIE